MKSGFRLFGMSLAAMVGLVLVTASATAGPTPTPTATPIATPSATPPDLDFFTDFEDVFPNTAPGEIIVVGVSPITANLGGDAFGGRIGIARFYFSGIRSWMVLPNGTGTVTFETDVATVQFWARTVARNGDMIITAFDGSDVIIDGPVTISREAGWQIVSFGGKIARIDLVNLDDFQMSVVDDFGFTVAPAPIVVEIDISPFRVINRVQLGSHQRVLVVVLGSESIDVTKIDAESLGFGPGGALRLPANKPAPPNDRNRDGFMDLVVHFDIAETGIAAGDSQACLTGKIDGALFEGCATVETFAPPRGQP